MARLINGIDLTIQLATCKASLVGESEWITGYRDGLTAAFDLLAEAPTIEAAPVKRGKWKLHKDGSGTCDQCHFTQLDVWDMDNWDNFCAHCGADMRERIET